jgi:cytochrome d ubiquinol oxidase subunit I
MWGNLIEFGGPILGLAFGWEGYAFMLEAVFLAFYVSTWGKIKGWKHWLIGVPVAIGSFGSAFAITLGNAWMQNPTGFEVVAGKVVTNDVVGALFTKTAFYMISHSVAGYYLATVLCVLGVYSFYMLRYKPGRQDRAAIHTIMFRLGATALVFTAITAILGHFQTQYLAQSQPRKFAAIENVESTTKNAPYIVGGEWTSDGKIKGGVEIPNALSILTGNSPEAEVKGLNEFPKQDWPKLFVNILFESKLALVAIITLLPLIFVSLHYGKLRKSMREWRYSKPMLISLLPLGLIAITVVELGWMVAEFGRQPFVVNGYMRTSEAYSAESSIGNWGYVFPILFIVLLIATATALWVLFKQKGKIKPAKGLL